MNGFSDSFQAWTSAQSPPGEAAAAPCAHLGGRLRVGVDAVVGFHKLGILVVQVDLRGREEVHGVGSTQHQRTRMRGSCDSCRPGSCALLRCRAHLADLKGQPLLQQGHPAALRVCRIEEVQKGAVFAGTTVAHPGSSASCGAARSRRHPTPSALTWAGSAVEMNERVGHGGGYDRP